MRIVVIFWLHAKLQIIMASVHEYVNWGTKTAEHEEFSSAPLEPDVQTERLGLSERPRRNVRLENQLTVLNMPHHIWNPTSHFGKLWPVGMSRQFIDKIVYSHTFIL